MSGVRIQSTEPPNYFTGSLENVSVSKLLQSNYFGKEYEVALLPDSDDETLPHNIKNCEETNKNKGRLYI